MQNVAEAFVSLALVQYFYDWDWANYEKNYRRARELNSNYAKNYYVHSQYLAATGRFDEAIAEALGWSEGKPQECNAGSVQSSGFRVRLAILVTK